MHYRCEFLCFFDQAQDGKRALGQIRGLGDVYKVQVLVVVSAPHFERRRRLIATTLGRLCGHHNIRSVSYTHLSLPTIMRLIFPVGAVALTRLHEHLHWNSVVRTQSIYLTP